MSHLLFADDAILFCEATLDQISHLCWLLMCFEALSGLKINLVKSELILIGSIPSIDMLARGLGCKVGNLPSTYLRLPLGARDMSVAAWDRVEEQFRKRLGLWKCQYISKGGRTSLVRRSTLGWISCKGAFCGEE